MSNKEKILNIAVIAHVDAGKSTLVDAFLRQSDVFRDNEEVVNCIMDSNDLERERGITIYSKNCSVIHNGVKINIVDTPGHADFSSEVERIIKTVDTVILLVDSAEGPMPQTRFVLQKSLENGLRPILLINKMDKQDARATEVIDECYDLMLELDATDDQLDFPILYGCAREGIVRYDWEDTNTDIVPLFETITHHAQAYPDLTSESLQMQITALAYDDYIGRLGIGRIYKGTLKAATTYTVCNANGDAPHQGRTNQIFVYKGLSRVSVDEIQSGEICMISGISDINIGDTLCPVGEADPLPAIKIEEPTLSMNFMVNDSPFAGQVGKFVTSRNIRERLDRELQVNVGLKVEDTDSTDTFKVSGRGELHLTVLLEQMRREGYEFAVSKAEVLYHKDENGKLLEPMEIAYIDVPDEYTGVVIDKLSQRKGELQTMGAANGGYTRLEFRIPSRGLIGYRGDFLTDTKGNGIMNTAFDGYAPYKGDIQYRKQGSLIAYETGESVTYGLYSAQERGTLFIGAGEKVYSGMVIGENAKTDDIEVNVCKTKHLTNTRSSSADDALRLTPPTVLSLEQAIDFIDTDELLEVTPESLRIRKKILDPKMRKRVNR